MRGNIQFAALVIAGAFGCNGLGPASTGQAQASLDDVDAGADAPGEPPPPAFSPLHVPADLLAPGAVGSTAPDLVLDVANTVIDTTAMTVAGASSPYFVNRDGYAILFARALIVHAPVKVTGGSPLILVASDLAAILSLIDVSASGRTPGPGAAAANPGGGGSGQSMVIRDLRVASGGGGAGYGSPGAPGGSNTSLLVPGAGGTTYDNGGLGPAGPLVGGSKGGNGGGGGTTFGGGGGGGGALQISSAIAIALGSSAQLKASGGGGGGGQFSFVGGGGGGSGGEILLEAPALTLAGLITANGGGGGGGGGGSGGCPTCVGGGDGQDGNASLTPAAGGIAGIPQGNPGGAGGIVPSPAAHAGVGFNSKGGGGGAGVGRIWLRYRAATPPALGSSVIAPPASTDPTMP